MPQATPAAQAMPAPQVIPATANEPWRDSTTHTARALRADLPVTPAVEPIPPPATAHELLPTTPALVVGPALTLDEALQMAVDANPTLRQAYFNLQQAQGNHLQVGLYPNPTFEWHSEANNAPFDAHFGQVSQELVTGKKLQLNRTVASFDVRRAQWEVDAQNLRVLNDVRMRYATALGAQRQLAVTEELLKIAENGVRISEQLFKGEEVSEADVLQARLQLNETQILFRNAQFQHTASWRQLANMIGRPELTPRPLAGQLDHDAPRLDWESAWSEVLNRNPQLHAARARVSAAQAQVRRELAEPLPNLGLAGYAGVDAIQSYDPQAKDFPMFMASMGAKLPVFDRNQGNIVAARAQLDSAEAEVRRLELTLRDELAGAFQRNQSAENSVRLYRDTILPLANRNLELAQKAYEAGEFDFLRVLTARRELFRANISYVEALVERRNTATQIEGLLLTGGLEAAQANAVPANSSGQTTGPGN